MVTLVTSHWARWCLKSTASRVFSQPFVQAQIKETIKVPRHWPLWGESTGDRWIPLTSASDVKLWCFLWSAHEHFLAEQDMQCCNKHAHRAIIMGIIFLSRTNRLYEYEKHKFSWTKWLCHRNDNAKIMGPSIFMPYLYNVLVVKQVQYDIQLELPYPFCSCPQISFINKNSLTALLPIFPTSKPTQFDEFWLNFYEIFRTNGVR